MCTAWDPLHSIDRCPAPRTGRLSSDTEDSPRGLWRTLGKRVGFTPSRVRIPHPPPASRGRTPGHPTAGAPGVVVGSYFCPVRPGRTTSRSWLVSPGRVSWSRLVQEQLDLGAEPLGLLQLGPVPGVGHDV